MNAADRAAHRAVADLPRAPRTRVAARVAAFVLLVGVLCFVAAITASASRADDQEEDAAVRAIERARGAALDYDFAAVVTIVWADGDATRTREVDVHARRGVLRLGDGKILGDADERVLRGDDGWRVLWDGELGDGTVDPGEKYELRVRDGLEVQGRAATLVIAATRRDGRRLVRERLVFDDETGLLLDRVQLDARSDVWREMRLTLTSAPTPAVALRASDLPGDGRHGGRRLRTMPSVDVAPRRVGEGFVLTGAYHRGDDGLHLYYSDGLVGISVFETDGELAWEELPTGGRSVRVAGVDARVYTTAAGTGLVWEAEGAVYTAVSEAPLGEVTEVVEQFSPEDDPGTIEELTRFVTAPFAWN